MPWMRSLFVYLFCTKKKKKRLGSTKILEEKKLTEKITSMLEFVVCS